MFFCGLGSQVGCFEEFSEGLIGAFSELLTRVLWDSMRFLGFEFLYEVAESEAFRGVKRLEQIYKSVTSVGFRIGNLEFGD